MSAPRKAVQWEFTQFRWPIPDSTPRYELRSLPGKFSGLQLVSLAYVGLKLTAPEQNYGFDLAEEYAQAKELFEQKRAT